MVRFYDLKLKLKHCKQFLCVCVQSMIFILNSVFTNLSSSLPKEALKAAIHYERCFQSMGHGIASSVWNFCSRFSDCKETSGDVAKCRLFSLANIIVVLRYQFLYHIF